MDRVDEVVEAWRRELPDIVGPTTELEKRVLSLAVELEAVTRGRLAGLGLTVAEYDVLAALRRAGSPYRMKPSVLVRELLLSSGGVTNVLKGLTDRGLTERQPDPDDGRASWVRLSAPGVVLAEQALRDCTTARAALFAALSPAAVDDATAALRELSSARQVSSRWPSGSARPGERAPRAVSP